VSSRREFLVQMTWLTAVPRAMTAFVRQSVAAGKATNLSSSDLENLAAAMDGIIPASDAMPSATSTGGLQYLQYLAWQYPHIQEETNRFLQTLTTVSAVQFQDDFPKLNSDHRVQVLAEIEKTQASTFATFVGYVYESYYTSPRVLGLLSCAPPSFSTEVDEELLVPVRKLAHLYREVP
jgi:hypothetical protein